MSKLTNEEFMSKLTDEELTEIMEVLEALSAASKEAGETIKTAMLVTGLDEEGNLEGELLIDNRKKEDLN